MLAKRTPGFDEFGIYFSPKAYLPVVLKLSKRCSILFCKRFTELTISVHDMIILPFFWAYFRKIILSINCTQRFIRKTIDAITIDYRRLNTSLTVYFIHDNDDICTFL